MRSWPYSWTPAFAGATTCGADLVQKYQQIYRLSHTTLITCCARGFLGCPAFIRFPK